MSRIIYIKVKPRSKKPSIQTDEEGHLIVSVRAEPIENKANEAVIEALSEYLKVPRSKIRLAKGQSSKFKKIEIND